MSHQYASVGLNGLNDEKCPPRKLVSPFTEHSRVQDNKSNKLDLQLAQVDMKLKHDNTVPDTVDADWAVLPTNSLPSLTDEGTTLGGPNGPRPDLGQGHELTTDKLASLDKHNEKTIEERIWESHASLKVNKHKSTVVLGSDGDMDLSSWSVINPPQCGFDLCAAGRWADDMPRPPSCTLSDILDLKSEDDIMNPA